MRKSQSISKETIKGGGIRLGRVALMAALLSTSAFVPFAHANPEGGQVVGGSATISESGKKLDVHQHTHRTVIDWRSFNIDVDEHTEFYQPSSSATALNRVKSADPSQILGKLSANGNVVLVNPNGVFFGRDSVVDVNGLVATTADIDTDKFMAGSNHFDIPGKPDAAIVNEGTITAKDAGLVGLVAPNVENHGVIKAKMGRVHLASGDTVVADFYGDGLLEVEVTDENVTSQFVGNTGKLEAEGGTVAITAAAARQTVNSLIVAKGELKAPTISKQGGKIIIAAAGSPPPSSPPASGGMKGGDGASTVIVQASLDASGRDAGEQGGIIEVLGDHIAILDGTVLDASGHSSSTEALAKVDAPTPPIKPTTDNGTATMTADKNVRSEEDFLAHENRAGGSIKIGGDYLGKGDTQTAKTLYVEDYVLALNDAIDNGDAGRTIFWSDETTDFSGLVLARGGVNSGNGGFLETSGKVNLLANGYADLTNRAEGFNKGTYLLDPADITIYGNFSPADLDNKVMWLDASKITGLNNGDSVNTWADSFGLNNVTANGAPTYVTNALNGLPTVNFNNDGMITTGNLSFGDWTIFALYNDVSTTTQYERLIDHDYINGFWFGRNSSNANSFGGGVKENGSPYGRFVNVTDGQWNLLGNQRSGTTHTIWANGDFSSGASGVVNGTATAAQKVSIGMWYSARGAQRAVDTNISEILIYSDALTTNERNLIEQYQSAKWGIALNPPGTGADEASQAMASDGYGVFTTDYLERLSASADIVLAADNTITLDLRGDTLALDNDRSISLTTTNGSITDVSAGTIRANRTGAGGNISITAGGAGDITLDTTNLEALGGGLVNLSAGGDVNLTQTSALNLGTVSGQSVFVQTTGGTSDITLNNTVNATDSGNALTIGSGRNFINNAGAAALNASHVSGRWLVYSANPSANTLGGLSNDFKRYNKTYAGYAPGSVVETGDGLLYSIAPTLSVTADDKSREYGEANPALTYSISGFIDSDTQGSATSGAASITSAATQNSNVGSYAINSALGTLASALGYQFTTFNDGTLTIDKSPVTVSLAQSSYSRARGEANPAFSLNYSGFKLGETSGALDSLPSASTGADTNSPGGQYAITISGGSDDNYSFSYSSPAGFLTVEGQADLPSSWEKVAYANDGLNLGVQSPAPLPSAPGGSTNVESGNTSETPDEEGENGENGNGGKPAVRNTQAEKTGEEVSLPGLNVTIEASLARTLGLTQEKLNEMFR